MSFRSVTTDFKEIEALVERGECALCGEMRAVPSEVPRVSGCDLSDLDEYPPPIPLCPQCHERHASARRHARAAFWLVVPLPLVITASIVAMAPIPWIMAAILLVIVGGIATIPFFRALRRCRARAFPVLISGGSGTQIRLLARNDFEKESVSHSGPYRGESERGDESRSEVTHVELGEASGFLIIQLIAYGVVAFWLVAQVYPTVRLDNPSESPLRVSVDGGESTTIEPEAHVETHMRMGTHNFLISEVNGERFEVLTFELGFGQGRLLPLPGHACYTLFYEYFQESPDPAQRGYRASNARERCGRWIPLDD